MAAQRPGRSVQSPAERLLMADHEADLFIIRSASRISKRRLRNFERTSLALRASPPNLGGDCLKQRILISISAETQAQCAPQVAARTYCGQFWSYTAPTVKKRRIGIPPCESSDITAVSCSHCRALYERRGGHRPPPQQIRPSECSVSRDRFPHWGGFQ